MQDYLHMCATALYMCFTSFAGHAGRRLHKIAGYDFQSWCGAPIGSMGTGGCERIARSLCPLVLWS
jgi:hypothetical protein